MKNSIARIAIAFVLCAPLIVCAPQNEVEAEMLVDELRRSPQPVDVAEDLGMSSCGKVIRQNGEGRILAQKVVSAGSMAIPHLEKAIREYLQDARDSRDARTRRSSLKWIFWSYARLLGNRAVPSLQRLYADLPDAELVRIQPALDAAMSVALSRTAYVSLPQPWVRSFNCEGADSPRETLRGFLLALMSGRAADALQYVEDPSAADRLSFAGAGKVTDQILPSARGGRAAVAFAMQREAWWAQPGGPFPGFPDDAGSARVGDDADQSVPTTFFTADGQECGAAAISFMEREPASPGATRVVLRIDALEQVVRLVQNCVQRQE